MPASPLKSHDSIVAVLFSGRVAQRLIPIAERMEATPNQVTLASFAIVLLAAMMIAFGGGRAWVVAAILIQVAFVLDCLDGQLARATGRVSDFGRYLDSVTDLVKVFLLISAMTVSLMRHGSGKAVCVLGALAFFGYLLCEYHTQIVRQFPQRSQAEYEQRSKPWKSWLTVGGQTIDVAFAIGEVMLTITLALLFGEIVKGLLVLLLVTPLQYTSYAFRFWRHRYAP